MLDNAIDTTVREKMPFTRRIPAGMDAFSYLAGNGIGLSYQIMACDSTAEACRQMMENLTSLFFRFWCDRGAFAQGCHEEDGAPVPEYLFLWRDDPALLSR